MTPHLPVSLPGHWESEFDSAGNVVLCARDATGSARGFATIDERRRVFALGMCRPYGRASEPAPEFQGRGWRERLFAGAIQTLQEAVGPLESVKSAA